jgi:hypothetical protein
MDDAMQEMFKAMMNAEKEKRRDHDLDAIREALSRPRLSGLLPGEVLRQKRLGEEFNYNMLGEHPVIFVRYATDADRVARSRGEPVRHEDIVIACYVDRADGELILHAVDSAFFERA